MEDSSAKETERKAGNFRTSKGLDCRANNYMGSSIIAAGLTLGEKIPLLSRSIVSVSLKPEAKLPRGASSEVNRLERNVIPIKLPGPHVQTQQQLFKENC